MFADLNSRDESFEKLLSTFNLLVPDARVELSSPRNAFRWHGKFAAANGLSWWHVESEIDWTCRLPHEEERFCLVFPCSGSMDARIRSRTFVAGPGAALVIGVPEIPQMGAYSGNGSHSRMSLKFDVGDVNRTLSSILEGATLRNVGLQPQLDLSSPAGQTLQALAETIAAGMRDASIRSGKAIALLSEAALRLIFENFPHRLSERLNRRLAGAGPRHVRAAIDFMHANLHQPLTLGDIAHAAGVSVRSLQAGFRRFRDTTPIAYLRDIRLEAAHAELSLPENSLPVSEVALKWGFMQLGRFAAQYRAVYGLRPSETARRARWTAR